MESQDSPPPGPSGINFSLLSPPTSSSLNIPTTTPQPSTGAAIDSTPPLECSSSRTLDRTIPIMTASTSDPVTSTSISGTLQANSSTSSPSVVPSAIRDPTFHTYISSTIHSVPSSTQRPTVAQSTSRDDGVQLSFRLQDPRLASSSLHTAPVESRRTLPVTQDGHAVTLPGTDQGTSVPSSSRDRGTRGRGGVNLQLFQVPPSQDVLGGSQELSLGFGESQSESSSQSLPPGPPPTDQRGYIFTPPGIQEIIDQSELRKREEAAKKEERDREGRELLGRILAREENTGPSTSVEGGAATVDQPPRQGVVYASSYRDEFTDRANRYLQRCRDRKRGTPLVPGTESSQSSDEGMAASLRDAQRKKEQRLTSGVPESSLATHNQSRENLLGDQVGIVTASSESDFSSSELHVPGVSPVSDRERSPLLKVNSQKHLGMLGKKKPPKVPSFSQQKMKELEDKSVTDGRAGGVEVIVAGDTEQGAQCTLSEGHTGSSRERSDQSKTGLSDKEGSPHGTGNKTTSGEDSQSSAPESSLTLAPSSWGADTDASTEYPATQTTSSWSGKTTSSSSDSPSVTATGSDQHLVGQSADVDSEPISQTVPIISSTPCDMDTPALPQAGSFASKFFMTSAKKETSDETTTSSATATSSSSGGHVEKLRCVRRSVSTIEDKMPSAGSQQTQDQTLDTDTQPLAPQSQSPQEQHSVDSQAALVVPSTLQNDFETQPLEPASQDLFRDNTSFLQESQYNLCNELPQWCVNLKEESQGSEVKKPNTTKRRFETQSSSSSDQSSISPTPPPRKRKRTNNGDSSSSDGIPRWQKQEQARPSVKSKVFKVPSDSQSPSKQSSSNSSSKSPKSKDSSFTSSQSHSGSSSSSSTLPRSSLSSSGVTSSSDISSSAPSSGSLDRSESTTSQEPKSSLGDSAPSDSSGTSSIVTEPCEIKETVTLSQKQSMSSSNTSSSQFSQSTQEPFIGKPRALEVSPGREGGDETSSGSSSSGSAIPIVEGSIPDQLVEKSTDANNEEITTTVPEYELETQDLDVSSLQSPIVIDLTCQSLSQTEDTESDRISLTAAVPVSEPPGSPDLLQTSTDKNEPMDIDNDLSLEISIQAPQNQILPADHSLDHEVTDKPMDIDVVSQSSFHLQLSPSQSYINGNEPSNDSSNNNSRSSSGNSQSEKTSSGSSDTPPTPEGGIGGANGSSDQREKDQTDVHETEGGNGADTAQDNVNDKNTSHSNQCEGDSKSLPSSSQTPSSISDIVHKAMSVKNTQSQDSSNVPLDTSGTTTIKKPSPLYESLLLDDSTDSESLSDSSKCDTAQSKNEIAGLVGPTSAQLSRESTPQQTPTGTPFQLSLPLGCLIEPLSSITPPSQPTQQKQELSKSTSANMTLTSINNSTTAATIGTSHTVTNVKAPPLPPSSLEQQTLLKEDVPISHSPAAISDGHVTPEITLPRSPLSISASAALSVEGESAEDAVTGHGDGENTFALQLDETTSESLIQSDRTDVSANGQLSNTCESLSTEPGIKQDNRLLVSDNTETSETLRQEDQHSGILEHPPPAKSSFLIVSATEMSEKQTIPNSSFISAPVQGSCDLPVQNTQLKQPNTSHTADSSSSQTNSTPKQTSPRKSLSLKNRRTPNNGNKGRKKLILETETSSKGDATKEKQAPLTPGFILGMHSQEDSQPQKDDNDSQFPTIQVPRDSQFESSESSGMPFSILRPRQETHSEDTPNPSEKDELNSPTNQNASLFSSLKTRTSSRTIKRHASREFPSAVIPEDVFSRRKDPYEYDSQSQDSDVQFVRPRTQRNRPTLLDSIDPSGQTKVNVESRDVEKESEEIIGSEEKDNLSEDTRLSSSDSLNVEQSAPQLSDSHQPAGLSSAQDKNRPLHHEPSPTSHVAESELEPDGVRSVLQEETTSSQEPSSLQSTSSSSSANDFITPSNSQSFLPGNMPLSLNTHLSFASPVPSTPVEFTSPSTMMSPSGLEGLKRQVGAEGVSRYELRHVKTIRTIIEQRIVSSEIIENSHVVQGSSRVWPETPEPRVIQEVKVELAPHESTIAYSPSFQTFTFSTTPHIIPTTLIQNVGPTMNIINSPSSAILNSPNRQNNGLDQATTPSHSRQVSNRLPMRHAHPIPNHNTGSNRMETNDNSVIDGNDVTYTTDIRDAHTDSNTNQRQSCSGSNRTDHPDNGSRSPKVLENEPEAPLPQNALLTDDNLPKTLKKNSKQEKQSLVSAGKKGSVPRRTLSLRKSPRKNDKTLTTTLFETRRSLFTNRPVDMQQDQREDLPTNTATTLPRAKAAKKIRPLKRVREESPTNQRSAKKPRNEKQSSTSTAESKDTSTNEQLTNGETVFASVQKNSESKKQTKKRLRLSSHASIQSSEPVTSSGSVGTASLGVGTKVIAKWKDKFWYVATITSIGKQGRFNVKYADGDSGAVSSNNLFHIDSLNRGVLVTAVPVSSSESQLSHELQPSSETNGLFEGFADSSYETFTLQVGDQTRTFSSACLSVHPGSASSCMKGETSSTKTEVSDKRPRKSVDLEDKKKKEPVSVLSQQTTADYVPRDQVSMFSGYIFVLTQRPKDEAQTASPSPQSTNREQIGSQIRNRGGKIVEAFKNHQVIDGRSFVLSDTYCRTKKYLLGLALAVPCVSYTWIRMCIEQGEVLDFNSYRLPTGTTSNGDDESTTVQWSPRERSTLLKGCTVHLVGASRFKNHWSPVLEAAGGKVLSKLPTTIARSHSNMDTILVVCEQSDHVSGSLLHREKHSLGTIRILTHDWILQCLIQGKKLMYENFDTTK